MRAYCIFEMKSVSLRIAYVVGFIAASCIGGFYLGAFISRFPFWVPGWLFYPVHAALQLGSLNEIDSDDGIEVLCDTFLWIAASSVVALALRLASALIRRHVRRQRRTSPK